MKTNTGTEQQNKDVFDQWFFDLLFKQESALLRAVLSDNKKNLFSSWMKHKPWIFPEKEKEIK